MSSEELDRMVAHVNELHATAWSDVDGIVFENSAHFEADVPCAVAAICHAHLTDLGQRLGAGAVKDWAVSGAGLNVYLVREKERSLVAVGVANDKPMKVLEKLKAQLSEVSESLP